MAATAGLAIVAGVAAGCGVPTRHGSPPAHDAAPTHPYSNPADAVFAATLTRYDQRSVDIAKVAATHTHDVRIQRLAEQIAQACQAQIDQLTALTARLAAASSLPLSPAPSDPLAGTTVPLGEVDVARLRATGDSAIDPLFLELLARQDQASVELAAGELRHGADPTATQLASALVNDRTNEIATIMNLIGTLPPRS
jgi:uncharacterized protein (DUF305 family)